jgi:hypothetical protein
LYPRSSASAARTPRRPSAATKTPFDEISVIGFKGTQAGVEQVALRNDDDVKAGRDLVVTENLSNQSFRSVSLNGSPELAGCRDTQPSYAAAVGQEEDGAVSAVNPGAALVDLFEFRAPANALVWAEPQLLAADSEALPALCAPALQHQAAIFGAHTHQKPMRLLAVTRIGLKSPDSLSHDIPSE